MTRIKTAFAIGLASLSVGLIALTSAASARSVAALSFDASKVRVGQDSFQVFFGQLGQTMPAGAEVVNIRRDGAGITFQETISAAQIGVQQMLTISLGAALEPLRRLSHGSFQGLTMSDSVVVRDGRVSGAVQTPSGPGTMQTSKVDAATPAGLLLDEDLLIALLPTADLSEGMKGTFSLIDDETGKLGPMDVAVEAKETVSVPAGQFEVYRVRAKGTETVVLYVSVASPHRVVRVTYEGAGVELRLVK